MPYGHRLPSHEPSAEHFIGRRWYAHRSRHQRGLQVFDRDLGLLYHLHDLSATSHDRHTQARPSKLSTHHLCCLGCGHGMRRVQSLEPPRLTK